MHQYYKNITARVVHHKLMTPGGYYFAAKSFIIIIK